MMLIWNRQPTTEKLIEGEIQLLEDHRKANKEILTRHFYDMSNMMSRNEGVWLSNGWEKTFFGYSCRVCYTQYFRLSTLLLRT